MINMFKKDIEDLIKASEKAKHFPDKFVNSIEHLHSIFAYILSLIEMKKNKRN